MEIHRTWLICLVFPCFAGNIKVFIIFKNTSLNKNNDLFYMHVDKLYVLVLLHYNLQCSIQGIVGNPWVIHIDSFFHHPSVHLVTFACFQSNLHDLCDLFLPNTITCYVWGSDCQSDSSIVRQLDSPTVLQTT